MLDMMQFYERAFNTQLCKDIATKADKAMAQPNQVCINGAWYDTKGTSINAAQVLQLARRDWCNSNYKVFYREDVTTDAPALELNPGVCIRLNPRMSFTVKKDDEDQWARIEMEKRFMQRKGMSL